MPKTDEAILLLQKISENTSSSDHIKIAIITTIAAISGTIIGAFVTYLTARIQAKSNLNISTNELRANTIAKARLEWLSNLRQLSVDVMADFEFIYNLLKRTEIKQSELDPRFDLTMRKSNGVASMLNPDKGNQKQIIVAINEYQLFLTQCAAQRNAGKRIDNDEQFRVIKDKMFAGLWHVGKETWGQVKDLR